MTFSIDPKIVERIDTLERSFCIRFEQMQHDLDVAEQAIATQYEMLEKLTGQLAKAEQAFANIVELCTRNQASLAQLAKAEAYSQGRIDDLERRIHKP